MAVRFTKKTLIDWAGAQVVRDAEAMVEKGLVLNAEYEPPCINGSVLWNSRELKTGLRLNADGTAESLCPCYTNRERGLICAHVIALALSLVRRSTDPERDVKYQAEMRHARRLANVDENRYLRRADPGEPGAMPARLQVRLQPGLMNGWRSDAVPMSCEILYRDLAQPIDHAPLDLPFTFDTRDENLLFVLEDICGGPVPSSLSLGRADFLNIVRLHAGGQIPVASSSPLIINDTPLDSILQLDLDRENGELIFILHTELPYKDKGELPLYLVNGRSGWVYGGGNLWPLGDVLPAPYHAIYEGPVIVARPDVLRFFRRDVPVLTEHARLASDISEDILTIEPAQPRFHLMVKGSPASLSAVLAAQYGDLMLVAGKPDSRADFAMPDPDDFLRYTVRNPAREKDALAAAGATGLRGECGDALSSIVGKREVLNFFASAMPALRRRGWNIEVEGRAAPMLDSTDFVVPVVQISDVESTDWFDIGFSFDAGEAGGISDVEIRNAIRKGEYYVERKGKTYLIDADAIQGMYDTFSDCAVGDGAASGQFRMSNTYAGFVKASLDAVDGIDIEETAAWRERASRQCRKVEMEPVALPAALDRIARPYQKTGVEWLRFLERGGLCGLLADEMGLGKTLQALAWLAMPRCDKDNDGNPALVVCPTSLVDNWAEEAAKFTPQLKVMTYSGPRRHEDAAQIPHCDLLVTSYAILRRDVDKLSEYPFSVVVLDEAQHIKNRSTQNAVAAKRVACRQRLVLTGTPIENSVADLWSIMDFLMPGYLGRHSTFRADYELPIARGEDEGIRAQAKLRRKMHPFLLRRAKTEVARDLPPKIERVVSCALSAEQKAAYVELLENSRRNLSTMVAKRGYAKCRMEILTTLTRLRQLCCHLDLLKLRGAKAVQPSGKMQMFFELLDEALDSGHRVLVFSQFVSMLTILRRELEARRLEYCYLDGSTKDRLQIVHTFNTRRDIPLFLISLKAGGVGLNLTGADMVIHFDPWWNPAVEDQATDRAHRIGQNRTVYSVKLITKGTVEEKVLALQRRKRDIINATIMPDDTVMKKLTWEDVQDLLEL